MSNSHSNTLLKYIGFDPLFFEKLEDTLPMKKASIIRIYSEEAISKIPTDISLNILPKNTDEERYIYDDVEEHYNNFKDENITFINFVEEDEQVDEEVLEEAIPEKQTDLTLFKNCSEDQLSNLKNILCKMNVENEKVIIKAYISKLKTKFYEIYEQNSQLMKEKIKYKIFHKCNYPSCRRTFASSGWLKSHFNEHLKEVKKNKFNILFDRYIESLEK
jgi:hypothetical protein